ncbi:FxSxx-COOH system tetratricopeptide repeat protein [Dactylosporangium sp. NPDC049140]|uniref:FxSxx-COOH system tetratricopeptide repeat protein n=1 Tax=Dactylosporangium sp. NPDC049140 TaxID=3155647 RepID=UPI0033CF110A
MTVLGSAATWTAVAAWPGHLDTQSAASVVGVVAPVIFAVMGVWAQRTGARGGPTAAMSLVPAQPLGWADGGEQLVVGDVPGQAVGWQDRVDLLDRLTTMSGPGQTTVVCALTGQRGIGKTQLAAAYARACKARLWPVIVWAVAETEAGIIAGLDALAGVAGLRQADTDPADAARAALGWLRAHRGPCLLVYDNAVDPGLIRRYTPSVGAVHTLVTTTRGDFDALGVQLMVRPFTADEASTYLQTRTGLRDPTGAAHVAEQLGRLPLALAQAGAIIGPHRRYPTHHAYLNALDRLTLDDLLPPACGDPYPHGAAEAILLAVEDLRAVEHARSARHLLDRLAVLAPTGADQTLLRHLAATHHRRCFLPRWRRGAAPDLNALVAVLAQRSLILPALDADRVVVHRLVQRVVRERLQHRQTLDRTITDAADAIGAAANEQGGRWDTRDLIADYTEHARALAALPAGTATQRTLLTLHGALQHWLSEVHNYSTAIAVGTQLVAESGRVLGPDHPHTLNWRYNLATVYRRVGRPDEAIALHERTLADRERVLGPDHPDTLDSRNNLAAAYQEAGRLNEAIALYERTIADRERVLGPDHPDTLICRSNLAIAYEKAGRLNEAIALHERTLADRERVLGPDHPRTLESRSNLAVAYQEAGRLNEAIALHERTIADRERVLGPDHPDTLHSRNNLAIAYQEAGRLNEAIALHERTLADRERVLGPDHPRTLESRSNLADSYQSKRNGRYRPSR